MRYEPQIQAAPISERVARRIAGGIGAAFLLFACNSAGAATCSDFERDVMQAVRSASPEPAAEVFERAKNEQACTGARLDLLGRNTALAFYARVRNLADLSERRTALLNRALTFGRPWQVLAAAADLAKSDKAFGRAAALYQEALDDIRDETLNPKAPPAEVIAALVKKAEETRLLAPTYVARRDQRGVASGLACPSFRGFEVRRTALPIEFEYKEPGFKKQGTAALTPKGRAAAEDLFEFLTQQGSPTIHLIGHTDPIASDEYNQALSERRAEAVKTFLVGKGFKGTIKTSGRGKSEPFAPDDPGSFTDGERHQLDRRVVLDRLDSGGAACGS